ncbi:ABC transporter permease [Robertmurraya korlensis]|uniref:ABC transporter permease n=1 Tax=Robertmurraya korlensis TaxID=519977 RepID=UPI0008258B21|nr:ABC transporter permease [Robertmurraya korlensis]
MKKSLLIAWKDFTIRVKDRKGFVTLLLTPLLLTAILGFALNSVMGGEGGFPETKVGVFVSDDDDLAEAFVSDVLPTIVFVKIKESKSEEELRELLTEGKVDVGILFPKEWSSGVNQGILKSVTLLEKPDQRTKTAVIESMLKSYSEQVQIHAVTTLTVMNDLSASVTASTSEINMKQVASEIQLELQSISGGELKEASIGEKNVGSMQYYAAAMAVMFLMFNMTLGAKSFLQERTTETLKRLSMTPTGKASILLGKFLGTLFFSFIQFIVFFGATSTFFKVDWGSNLYQVITVGFCYSFAVSGLSMTIAAFVKEEKTTDVISSIGIQILAILGGSMLPIYLFPEGLKTIASVTPNKWALTSFLDIMSGTTWSELFPAISILLLLGFITLALGTWKLKTN